jgi:hypothetical protein
MGLPICDHAASAELQLTDCVMLSPLMVLVCSGMVPEEKAHMRQKLLQLINQDDSQVRLITCVTCFKGGTKTIMH